MERRQEHEGMRLWKVWESEMLEGSKGRWLVQETVLARKSKLGSHRAWQRRKEAAGTSAHSEP